VTYPEIRKEIVVQEMVHVFNLDHASIYIFI